HTGFGDRVTYQQVALGIDKTADQSAPLDDLLLLTQAGETFLWSLTPTVSSSVPGTLAINVRVVDTLPATAMF
ncbi:MAG TPA: hypothetical protein PLV68_18140, partial [Ilumatobacteraceae bacterium]|nr:hypothetical protein [Ilumatobacteraceae bacterium]